MIRSGDAFAYWLQPVNSAGIPGRKSSPRAASAAGPDGTSDDGPPPPLRFSVSMEKYGLLTVKDIEPEEDYNIDGVTQVHVVALYADEPALETVDIGSVSADAETIPFSRPEGHEPGDYYFFLDLRKSPYYPVGMIGYYPPVATRFLRDCLPSDDVVYVENPAGFPAEGEFDIYFETSIEGMKVVGGQGTNVWVVQRPIQGTRDFHAAGDLVFWYPTPPLEELAYMTCCECVQSDPEGGNFLWRKPPALRGIQSGDMATFAYFNSRITSHPDTKLVRLRPKSFSIPVKRGFDIPGYADEIPKRIDCVLPNALVYAVMVALENYYGYGPWRTANLTKTWPATDDLLNHSIEPGIRTANGAAYIFQQPGDIKAAALPVMPVRVQETVRVRTAYATLESPSTGKDVRIVVRKRLPGEEEWRTVLTCVIPAGQKTSWSQFERTPAEVSMPYPYDGLSGGEYSAPSDPPPGEQPLSAGTSHVIGTLTTGSGGGGGAYVWLSGSSDGSSWVGPGAPGERGTIGQAPPEGWTDVGGVNVAAWPPPLLEADAELCYDIVLCGSGAKGLMVVIQT